MTDANDHIIDLELAVTEGAKWLDQVKPTWPQLIDLRTLDLSESTSCVLGQTFAAEAAMEYPDDFYVSGYNYAYTELLDSDKGEHLDFGFEQGEFTYSELQGKWRELIEDRQRGA